ncbi:MAG: type III pantothenate kinase [Candidatus Ancillula sp.]|jgi:type III pantothenate kinase|nr:type III pantothenate kinase [Candidatus Ancillula sp.]
MLVVNIGNTNTYFRDIESGEQVFVSTHHAAFRTGHTELFSRDQNLHQIISKSNLALIASVVPKATIIVQKLLEEQGYQVEMLDKMDTSVLDAKKFSSTLGDDRFAECYQAVKEFGGDILVIDFGTATTINIIQNSNFVGGQILLGAQTSLNALHQMTALLPDIQLKNYDQGQLADIPPVATTTESNMLAGVIVGAAESINGMTERLQQTHDYSNIVITGGNATYILPYLRIEYSYRPHLLMDGLVSIASK